MTSISRLNGNSRQHEVWRNAGGGTGHLAEARETAVVIDDNGLKVSTVQRPFTAIPYYAWAHRGKGEMMIWFPEKLTNIDLIAK